MNNLNKVECDRMNINIPPVGEYILYCIEGCRNRWIDGKLIERCEHVDPIIVEGNREYTYDMPEFYLRN